MLVFSLKSSIRIVQNISSMELLFNHLFICLPIQIIKANFAFNWVIEIENTEFPFSSNYISFSHWNILYIFWILFLSKIRSSTLDQKYLMILACLLLNLCKIGIILLLFSFLFDCTKIYKIFLMIYVISIEI